MYYSTLTFVDLLQILKNFSLSVVHHALLQMLKNFSLSVFRHVFVFDEEQIT